MFQLVLAIIGIVIALFFGIFSLWSHRVSRRIAGLKFENKECYSLFKNDVNRLNIQLNYNKAPISNNLILLKAHLMNYGNLDIDKTTIHSPLKIISPEHFKWLESVIIKYPEGATTDIKVLNEKEIQIGWDLLKAEETIVIEDLADIMKIP